MTIIIIIIIALGEYHEGTMESQRRVYLTLATIQWGNKGIMSPSQHHTSEFYNITAYVPLSNSQMPINLSFGHLISELCVSFSPQ